MIASKLTLSADKKVIADAKRLAAERHTSVSALFARFVSAMKQIHNPAVSPVTTPLSSKAAGLIRVPDNVDDKALITDAMADKYAL